MVVEIGTKVLLFAVLASTHWVTSPVLANPTAQRFRREISQRLPQSSMQMSASPTPCRDAGYTTGCCENGYCYVFSSDCFCDDECYTYFDCCQDINDIGCADPQASCPDNLTVTNGEISYSSSTRPWRPGTVATYNCNNGYALVGSPTQVCQQNSTWNGSDPWPECRKTCAELSLENGRITYEPHSSSSRKPLRTVATYSCDEGYVLNVENEKRVCQESGGSQQWSGISIQCVPRLCRLVTKFSGTCCTSSAYFCTIGPHFDRCSCSVSCYTDPNSSCCPDVGCVRQNCTVAGLSNGCCNWHGQDSHLESKGCYVPESNCYCDEECSRWHDCCDDVNTSRTDCSSTSSQIYIGHESARTKLYSTQAQIASRKLMNRGGQKLEKDKAVRELAGELRSMSRVQELSNREQRVQWETILSELQEIQKNKN